MIRVGYVPYAINLLHPADRRRLASWANEEKVELNTIDPLNSDVLVLSNAANFGYWLKRAKQPVILDLVDGYLGEDPSFLKDIARNIVRSLQGLSSFHWITYTRHLRYACQKSQMVVVASPEQMKLVLKFNSNVYVILDNHSELDLAVIKSREKLSLKSRPSIFWEGFGFTLKHFEFMASDLDRFLMDFNWQMYLVTPEQFPRYGGYLGKVHTAKVVKKLFPKSWKSIKIIPWTIDNLAAAAIKSSLAIIPITPLDKFANLKSENKLLSMWHLALPTLTSPIPSYQRVISDVGTLEASVGQDNWYERLSDIANSPVSRHELGRAGNDYVLAHHTHLQLVKKWDEIITQAQRLRGNNTGIF